jgi:hypothetical protein
MPLVVDASVAPDLALRETLVLATLDAPMRKAAEQFGVIILRQ